MSSKHKNIPILTSVPGSTRGWMELFCVGAAFYQEIDEAEAKSRGEAPHQIQEGCEYEYALKDGLRFKEHRVVSCSMRNPSMGRIRPGNYVGRLSFTVLDESGAEVGVVELESTSVKLDYRTDYQNMLTDIAEKSTELLMSSDEYVLQHFEVDSTASPETLYEQFAFIKSLIASEAFDAAVARVCASPIKAMRTIREVRHMASAGRLARDGVRQIASAVNRDSLPEGHYLRRCLRIDSVPHIIEHDMREETVDVAENSFVKFVLESFLMFLRDISLLENASKTLKEEAEILAENLDYRLGDPLFRSVSNLDRLPLSSVALQRREGYREILRAWLMFESAAKIAWRGGENVYRGGKRDVAVLYEYWAFFKLIEIISRIFDFEEKEFEKLITRKKNNLELSLIQGQTMKFEGRYAPSDGSRKLKVQFTYNKTFKYKENLECQGSWTVDMRPDYTLSLWPDAIEKIQDAEKIDAVVHVHFDAKYKIDKFIEIFDSDGKSEDEGDDGNDLTDLKDDEARGVYKRGDLLKMHAYNDAIRRTYGSYVLYPGDKDDPKRRYREILPGIGAFVLKPEKTDDVAGANKIEEFIRNVVSSLQDRLTQRERMANYGHHVHKEAPHSVSGLARKIELPEYNESMLRPFIPSEEYVIVGYFKNVAHLEWILKNAYNFRLGRSRGSLVITPGMTTAQYLLLHGAGEAKKAFRLFKIDRTQSGVVWSKSDLISKKYPGTPSSEHYMMFKLIEIKEGEPFYGGVYDITKLNSYKGSTGLAIPFDSTITELLSCVC